MEDINTPTAHVPTPKQLLWFYYYTCRENKETYLNAGKSAMQVYNCSSIEIAYHIGSTNKRKLEASHLKPWREKSLLSEEFIKANLERIITTTKTHLVQMPGAVDRTTLKEGVEVYAESGVVPLVTGAKYVDGNTLLGIEVPDTKAQVAALRLAADIQGYKGAEAIKAKMQDSQGNTATIKIIRK